MLCNVISDLHLETEENYTFHATAPFLMLLGDIVSLKTGEYQDVIRKASECYQHVFWVLGNHDFYGGTIEEGNRIATRIAGMFHNVHFLQRDVVDLPELNVSILGCTLFSRISSQHHNRAQHTIADFRHIHHWNVHDHNQAFKVDCQWIRDTLMSDTRCEHILLLTHHAPVMSGVSAPEYELNGNLTTAFQSDVERQVSR